MFVKRSLFAAIVLSAALSSIPERHLKAGEIQVEDSLLAMSKDATTPAQHAEVAKRFRLHAESLEAKASEHERAATEAARRPLPPIAHKWPAMHRDHTSRARKLAREHRKAAEKARELASYHLSRSVEAGFGL